MANTTNAVRTGLYSLLLGNTTLKNLVKQTIGVTSYYKIYASLAPDVIPGTSTRITLPYIVFDIIGVERHRDSGTFWYTAKVQVTVAADDLTEAENILGQVTTVLDECEDTLVVTGYTNLAVDRGLINIIGVSDGVWTLAVQYDVTIQPT